jgi:ferredoxin--NADP+ reductase
MAHLVEYSTQTQYKAIIRRSERLTPPGTDEVREIILEVKDPEFKCMVDQSFGVLVKAKGEFGNTYHHRLYSVADIPDYVSSIPMITLLVKRCAYIDPINGERYKGVVSNYLCDLPLGEEITITGPFELPFKVPEDKTSNLILIGMGTGIAPFRAFIKHIYKNVKGWKGQILLFYGARSGLELLYLNDKDGDLTNYYDEETFQAFRVLSQRPEWFDPIELDKAIEDKAGEILELLSKSNTYIYVAGYEKVKKNLDKAFSNILRSNEKWLIRKAELIAGHKWAEIIY